MTFIFNTTIPAANNNPSFDQPDMLTNNQSTDGILAVDHVSFNTNNGGNHLQVHLTQYQNPAVVNGSATEGSVIYGAAGTADSAHAQCFFKNPNGIFPVSALRSFGSFAMTPNNVTIINGINFTVLVDATALFATVTLTAGVVAGSNYVVIGSYSSISASSSVFRYTIVGSVITFFVNVATGTMSFEVLQI